MKQLVELESQLQTRPTLAQLIEARGTLLRAAAENK